MALKYDTLFCFSPRLKILFYFNCLKYIMTKIYYNINKKYFYSAFSKSESGGGGLENNERADDGAC